MNNKYVVTLEVAKKLAAAGWHKDTEYVYCDTADKRFNQTNECFMLYDREVASSRKFNSGGEDTQFPAPMVVEILEGLRNKEIETYMRTLQLSSISTVELFRNINLVAEMWLYITNNWGGNGGRAETKK